MNGRPQHYAKWQQNSRLFAAASLLLVIFTLGGSSRADYVPSIIVLTLSAGFAGVFAPYQHWRELRPIAVPLGLIGAMVALCLFQLVPLPGWYGRPLFESTEAVVGISRSWRPISVSPVSTWSVFAALFVPLAALIALVGLPPASRRLVVPLLLIVALISALLGVAQSLSGADSALYYYEYTNRGSPVGIFANRNHQAVFLACGLVWAGYVFANPPGQPSEGRAVRWSAAGIAVVLFVCVLANASRAGLISLCLAAMFVVLLIVSGQASVIASSSASLRANGGGRWRKIALPGLAAAILGTLASLFFFQSKIPALDRLMSDTAAGDLRGDVTPTLIEMAARNMPWGTGMGTFERAYRVVEPDALLMPSYLNNAHNDWLQLVIEGGIPAVLLLCCAIGWIATRLVGLWRLDGDSRQLALCVGSTFAILAAASLVDYPLRTPSLMTAAVLLVGLLGFGPAKIPDIQKRP